MRKPKLLLKKWDMVAIAGVLLLATLVFILFLPKGGEGDVYAEIYLDGELIKTVSLSQDQEFTISGQYENTIAIRDGSIAVIHSDCPGGDCVACGWMHAGGRSIVCLPNGLEIRIVSKNDDVDFVVG